MTQADIKTIYLKALACWLAACGLALAADGALWLAGFDGDRGARLLVGRGLEALFRSVGVLVVVYLTTMAMYACEKVDDLGAGVGELGRKVDLVLADLAGADDYGDIDDEELDDLWDNLDDDDDLDPLEGEDDEPFLAPSGLEPLRTTY